MYVSVTLGGAAGIAIGVTLSAAVFLALFAWIANNPANAERIAFWFWSAFRLVSARAENKRLVTGITHRINDFALRTADQIGGYTPIGIEIKLIEGRTTPEAFVDGGKLVVRLAPAASSDRSFLTVALLYVARTLFPSIKTQLREAQREALDLYTTEKLIRTERALMVDEFLRDFINPLASSDRALEALLTRLHELDQAGLFLAVLCQELQLLGARMIGFASREALRSEIENFLSFLEGIARRRTGDTSVPLAFQGRYLRVAVQIVSVSKRREQAGGDPTPWVRFASSKFCRGDYDHVYFVGNAAEANRALIVSVANEFCIKNGWDIFREVEHPARVFAADGSDRTVGNYLVLCRSRSITRIAA